MKKIIAILLCISLFACSEKKSVSIPDTVLSKEKMAVVLVDIHLMEACMNMNINNDKNSGSAPLVADVFKKNKITKKQYDESFEFYTQNPQLLGEIYQSVLNDLSKMQAQVMNKK
jgi:hypothetical protein